MALLGFPVAREFLRLESRDRVPDHSWLSRTRARLPHEVHTAIFDWVLALIAEAGLVKGERIGVDARPWRPTRRCATSCGGTRARVTGGCWRAWPRRRHRDSRPRTWRAWTQAQGQEALEPGLGLEERPRGQDRQDEGRHDPSGLQASTRWIWTPARWWPPSYTRPTRATRRRWRRRWRRPRKISRRWTRHRRRRPGRMCDRQGLSLTVGLKGARRSPLEDADSPRPKQKGFARWHGDGAARRAVQPDPAVIGGQGSLQAARRDRRALLSHNLDRRLRRTWLRGRENVHKRYLLHVAGHNLSLLMRKLIGAGTPREAVAGGYGCICALLR